MSTESRIDAPARATASAMMLGRHRQPRLARDEAGIRAVAVVPRHRRAAAVAALELRPERDAVGILQLLERQLGFGQAEFLALIEADRAAQRSEQRGEQLAPAAVEGCAPPQRSARARRRGWKTPSTTSRRSTLRFERFDRAADVRGAELVGSASRSCSPCAGVCRRRCSRPSSPSESSDEISPTAATSRIFVEQRAEALRGSRGSPAASCRRSGPGNRRD